MTDAEEQIKCVLLNINEDQLILPKKAVAEVVPIRNIINVANKPDWMLGYLDWRGNSIPLVSIEAMGGIRMPSLASGDVKAAVVYVVSEDASFNFMSFLVKGTPKVINIKPASIVADEAESQHPAVEQKILVHGEKASIVDLLKLESIIRFVMT
ncbi:MAG: chemotaxis protein CheW [Gammaproteobacteria bacterium]|nr:chemotaxis protein CheW [Gammaproteobacteria bacterium]MCW8910425.1 chemotaxis protein CheW [Gammaproteobacteria bacterium]MCW9005932.1 chemotaxis protein CheW [Gammaproteobacteria bacterium]MCW9056584.1 chemotaxis protein CheW [Gammaproteobacteria bacterium]